MYFRKAGRIGCYQFTGKITYFFLSLYFSSVPLLLAKVFRLQQKESDLHVAYTTGEAAGVYSGSSGRGSVALTSDTQLPSSCGVNKCLVTSPPPTPTPRKKERKKKEKSLRKQLEQNNKTKQKVKRKTETKTNWGDNPFTHQPPPPPPTD